MPTPQTPRPDRARGAVALKVLAIVAVVVIVAGFAAWWFLIRSDAEPKPEITTTPTVAGGTIDGTWVLTANDSDGSFVQYRVHEVFASGLVDNEATGKTSDVTGSLTVSGTTVSGIEVTANVASLESDQSFRDNALKGRGLETDKFPTATFTSTEDVTLPAAPTEGETVTIDVTGDLELHGVTKTVTVSLEGRWDGETIQVVGEVPILFPDYGITAPTGGPIASVDDNGTLEMKLFFTKER